MPPPEVTEAVAAVKRYFEGEQTDFSGFTLDLGSPKNSGPDQVVPVIFRAIADSER